MNKISILLIASLMCFSVLNITVVAGSPYVDAISFVKQEEIMIGYPNGDFGAEQSINRAEVLKVLYVASGKNINTAYKNNFSDTVENAWYLPYLAQGVVDGIIDGYPDGTFHPERGVNRAEFSKMFSNSFNLEVNQSSTELQLDVSSSDWFSSYSQIFRARDFLLDNNDYFFPAKYVSRQEVAYTVYVHLNDDIALNEQLSENVVSTILYPEYSKYEIYQKDDIVSLNGVLYRAKWWNTDDYPAKDIENVWETPWEKISVLEANDTGNVNITSTTDTSGVSDTSDLPAIPASSTIFPDQFYAPYVDSTLYPVAKIAEIAEETNQKYFNLAFLVAENASTCEASWGGYYSLETGPSSWGSNGEYFLYDEIQRLRQNGGDIIISLGGAAGVPLANACSEDDLLEQYKKIIEKLNVKIIDFDIEGGWVADPISIEKRSKVLKKLQDYYIGQGKELEIWYTLPVLPSGLTHEGINVIENAFSHGVSLSGVNVMTMDYGDSAAPNPEGQMGEYGIQAITNLHIQLKASLAKYGVSKSDVEVWKMVGTTPMIGLNDIFSENFTLQDARETVIFAKEKGVRMLSNWSVNRDHACPTKTQVDITCSSTASQTKDWEFMKIFQEIAQ